MSFEILNPPPPSWFELTIGPSLLIWFIMFIIAYPTAVVYSLNNYSYSDRFARFCRFALWSSFFLVVMLVTVDMMSRKNGLEDLNANCIIFCVMFILSILAHIAWSFTVKSVKREQAKSGASHELS